MKKVLPFLSFLYSFVFYSQVIQIDPVGNPVSNYSSSDLIEKVLVNSGCANISNVTHKSGIHVGFKSYGYFNRGNSNFPLKEGVILSTGKASSAVGPNNKKGSYDGEGVDWVGDSDIEKILNKHMKNTKKTFNATVFEFDFIPIGNRIDFQYLFASEEYDLGFVCVKKENFFQDGFAFLISGPGIVNDEGLSGKNIALIPNTEIVVSAGTINGGDVEGECGAVNPHLYYSYNNNKTKGISGSTVATNSPVDFMGRTVVLNAQSTVIPNKKYHIKLVIADRGDGGFTSAVFLAAGSFNMGVNLGEDRTIKNNNPPCIGETINLDAGNHSGATYKWYETSKPNTIIGTNSSLSVNKSGTYKVEVALSSDCTSSDEVKIEFASLPTVNKTVTLKQCDDDTDGFSVFNLIKAETLLVNDPTGITMTYYKTLNDANNKQNAIANPKLFSNKIQDKVFVRIENKFNCYETAEIKLIVSTTSIPNTMQLIYTECDTDLIDNDDSNGITTFNLANIANDIKNIFPSNQNLQVTFYKSKKDAIEENNVIKTSEFRNENSPFSQNIFVRVENATNKSCLGVKEITLKANPIPQFDLTKKAILCLNKEPVLVEAENPLNIESYQWYDNSGNPLPNGNKSSYAFQSAGTYKLKAITSSSTGCNKVKTVVIETSNIPTVNNIEVVDKGLGSTIKISVNGEGTYQYALEDREDAYQNSNIIENLKSGNYTLYIRDIKGCGKITKSVNILGFSKFFTPNEDGHNDTWRILGANPEQLNSDVYIYDRFGKLLKKFKVKETGWDGTYKGKPLPSSDYWFSVNFKDGNIQKGNFSLIRK